MGTTGSYSFLSSATSTFNNYLALYATAFDAASVDANLVITNDDNAGATTRAGVANVTLTAGTTYYLVTTGTAADQSGSFIDTIAGPGSFTVLG